MALHIGQNTTLTNSNQVVPPNNNFLYNEMQQNNFVPYQPDIVQPMQQQPITPQEVRVGHGPGYVTHFHPRPSHGGDPLEPTNYEKVLTYTEDYQFGPFPSYMPRTEDNIRRLYPEMKRNLGKIVNPIRPDDKLSNLRVSPKPTKADRIFNTIKTISNPHVGIIDHDNANDIFFSQRNLMTGYNNVIDDSDFHTPCRQTYIFNTMKEHIPYVLYPDNTPSTVQNKDFSGISDASKRYLLEMLSLPEKQINNLEGVFVIEYKEIIVPRYNGIRYSTEHIMEYYKNSVDIYPGAKFITSKPNEPNQTAGKAIYEKMRTHHQYHNELNGHSIYRVVTFIPKKDLVENIEVYVQHLGLVIGIGEIHDRVVHPTYQPYIDYHRNMGIDIKNGIYVEINNPYSINREYYYKLGKTILKIKSMCDPNIQAGATIKHYINGAQIDHITSSLEDMEDELGIYSTYDDALYDGDIKGAYEKLAASRKLEIDNIKIQNEARRINIERTKQTTEYLKIIPAVLTCIVGVVGLFMQFKKK